MSTQSATAFRWFFVALCAQISLFYYKYTYVYTYTYSTDTATDICIICGTRVSLSYDKVEFKVYELDSAGGGGTQRTLLASRICRMLYNYMASIFL